MSIMLRCRKNGSLAYMHLVDVRHLVVVDRTDYIVEKRFGSDDQRFPSGDPDVRIEALGADGETYQLVDRLPSAQAAERLLDRTVQFLLEPDIQHEAIVVVVHPSGPGVFTDAEPGSSVHAPIDD